MRRKVFLCDAGFYMILSLLEAEQQVRKVKDDSLENETSEVPNFRINPEIRILSGHFNKPIQSGLTLPDLRP